MLRVIAENCGGGTRTHDDRFNRAAPYQLGYTTSEEVAGAGIEPAFETAYETAVPPGHIPAQAPTAAAGLEPAHTCLLDKRSVIRLSYAARMDREGLEPSQEVCKTSMQPLHHQP